MKQSYHAPRFQIILPAQHAKLRLRILVKKGCVELAMLAMFDGGVFGDHLKSAYIQTWQRADGAGTKEKDGVSAF